MNKHCIQKAIRAIFVAVLIGCGLVYQQARAAEITGNITFAGTVNLDSLSAGTATMVTEFHGLAPGDEPQVQTRDGDFAAFVTPGDGLTFLPYSFTSGAVPSLWSVDGFTFDLTSSAIPSGDQTSNSVTVQATGTISGHGFDPTPATFEFTTQDPAANGLFSFSGSSAAVPEPATLMSLLSGSSLLGAAVFIRRRRS